MGQLREIESEIEAVGYQLFAIAPDKIEKMRATKAKYGFRARFLSDGKMNASRSFRIAYEVDAETLAQLASHGVDLEAASGETHHELPVPAVYSIAANGRIQFAYVNPDYKTRLDPQLLLAALRAKTG